MDSLPTDLRLAIGRVARRLRALYAEPTSTSAISFLELAVLSSLERKGPTSPGRLAGDERVTSAAVAGVLRTLESAGLVTRRPDDQDGRRVVVELTDAGRGTLRDHDRTVTGRLKEVLDTEFSASDQSVLAAAVPLLQRLGERL